MHPPRSRRSWLSRSRRPHSGTASQSAPSTSPGRCSACSSCLQCWPSSRSR